MEKFQGKYRITSARLRNWDYASCGIYFITICTRNREHYFGQIRKKEKDTEHFEMQLSEIGKIVESEWARTPEVRPDMNIDLGEYQVMPNHFHAILIIGKNQFNAIGLIRETNQNPDDSGRDGMRASPVDSESKSIPDSNPMFKLEMQMILETDTKGKNKFAPQSKNLGSVMRGFKSTVTSYAKDHHIVFGWQPRFYDHIIRNYDEYQIIANYIRNNPYNWGNDYLR